MIHTYFCSQRQYPTSHHNTKCFLFFNENCILQHRLAHPQASKGERKIEREREKERERGRGRDREREGGRERGREREREGGRERERE